ncbi:MAG: hypothetical protein K2X48_04565 [Chitinophagaceae bacterium]|nr:hypothetical protein [Chitinophagaceae bacterium]
MILRIPLLFEGSKHSKNLYALFDSGATYSCINKDQAKEPEGFISSKSFLKLHFYKDGVRLGSEFLVMPGLMNEVIIGAGIIKRFNFKFDWVRKEYFIQHKLPKLIPVNE